MLGREIIVVGASAGGVEALKTLVQQLPADLPAAIFVVLHIPPTGTSILPQIINRNGHLPAHHPSDGEKIVPGTIYVAPPDFHLIIRDGTVGLSRGPKENGHRPSADVLFRSAARSYGPRVVGVVLSGNLDDGTAGLLAIKERGGLAVVQDPDDALYPSMPRSALRNVTIDHRLPVAEIAGTLEILARDPVPNMADQPIPDDLEFETDAAEFHLDAIEEDDERPGEPSGFGCPDCGGALWELRNGEMVRFRCRVGHAWSSQSLLARQSESLEEALWVALRALEERAALSGRLAERIERRGIERLADRYRTQMGECQRQASLIRSILVHPPPEIVEDDSSEPTADPTKPPPAKE